MGRGISKGKAKSCHRLLHAQVCKDGGCKKVGGLHPSRLQGKAHVTRITRVTRVTRVTRAGAQGPDVTRVTSRASRGSAEMHACAGLKFRAQALTRPAASVSALLLLTTYSRHSFVAAHTATAAATKHWAFRLRRCLLLGSCSCGFKAMLFMLLDLSCFLRSLFAVLGATRSPRVPGLAP